MDEHRLRQCAVWRLRDADPLPGQRLDDAPVVQVVEVGVGVEVRQRHAVQLGVGQGADDVRLQSFYIL